MIDTVRCLSNRAMQVMLALALSSVTNISAQSVFVAGSVNGVLNPTQYSGADIGAKINTAWKSGATVRIPAGTYSFATTIVHPGAGFKLDCDAGAVLEYTGSGDAITLANGNFGAGQNAGIDGNGGCELTGTSKAQSGIHIYPSNHTFVRNIRISGFTNASYGYGIYDTGGNSVEINNVSIRGSRTGIYLTGITASGSGYAANAVHIEDSDISANSNLAVDSEDSGCGCSENLGNVISNNVFEGNGVGDIELDWDNGASITGNYFESAGVGVNLGPTQNEWGITVEHNYFTEGSPESIEIGYGSNFNIDHNALYTGGSNSSGCFINVTTGTKGYGEHITGVGTNFIANTKNEFCNASTGTTSPGAAGTGSTTFNLEWQ